jgi:hypothetical protein
MREKKPLPLELAPVRDAARRALGPVIPAASQTQANQSFLFDAKRTNAGRELPPYYLVYFLLVELLGFENLGQFEKIAWSVPVDFRGRAFLIEHRKLGVGVFAHDPETEEDAAREIVSRIKKGVSVASPFFDWLGKEAVAASALNVVNNSDDLYARFAYFREAYRKKADEALSRKDETTVRKGKASDGSERTIISRPATALEREARCLALAAIETFFSWTEHVFIHIAILNGALKTGADVARLAESEWSEKFKCALDISELISKQFYDRLLDIRRGLRNFVAHGAFGKDGKAFSFHSGAGAVPVLLPHRVGAKTFTIGEFLTFNDDAALGVIDKANSAFGLRRDLGGAPGCFSGCARARASINGSKILLDRTPAITLADVCLANQAIRVAVAIAIGSGVFQVRFERSAG